MSDGRIVHLISIFSMRRWSWHQIR